MAKCNLSKTIPELEAEFAEASNKQKLDTFLFLAGQLKLNVYDHKNNPIRWYYNQDGEIFLDNE